MGRIYAEGRLVPKDAEEAARWFSEICRTGLCACATTPWIDVRDLNPSVGERWMLRAAEQGDVEAQFWLGVAYEQNWFGTADVKSKQ